MTVPEQKNEGYITLKEASERFGYAPDYVGQLIRKGKIEGKQVYANVAWMTTEAAMEEYIAREKSGKETEVKREWSLDNIVQLLLSKEYNKILLWMIRALGAVLVLVLVLILYFLSISIDHHLEERAKMRLEERMSARIRSGLDQSHAISGESSHIVYGKF